MLHHRAGTHKAADAGCARLVRALPAPAFLMVLAVSASCRGDIMITEKTAAARRSKPGRCFNQQVAPASTLFFAVRREK